jgi:DNA-binding transcriptional regulator YhcF (GntR family)
MNETSARAIPDAVGMSRELELTSLRVERGIRALVSTLEPGTKVPSLREIADGNLPGIPKSSKRTVQQVMAKLVAEGILVTRDRWGTFKRPA